METSYILSSGSFYAKKEDEDEYLVFERLLAEYDDKTLVKVVDRDNLGSGNFSDILANYPLFLTGIHQSINRALREARKRGFRIYIVSDIELIEYKTSSKSQDLKNALDDLEEKYFAQLINLPILKKSDLLDKADQYFKEKVVEKQIQLKKLEKGIENLKTKKGIENRQAKIAAIKRSISALKSSFTKKKAKIEALPNSFQDEKEIKRIIKNKERAEKRLKDKFLQDEQKETYIKYTYYEES